MRFIDLIMNEPIAGVWLLIACLLTAGCCETGRTDQSKAIPGSATRSMHPPATADAQMSLHPHTFRQIHMAMPVEITVWAPSPDQAEAAAKDAFARVALVDRLMNDYVPDSEISRLSDAAGEEPVKVSPEMLTVLQRAKAMYKLTGGAFDPTAAPVIAFWREASRTGALPDPESLAASRRLVGMDKVEIDPEAGTASLAEPGMRLDFGGIAKGYACDLATEELQRHGLTITYVQAGGDMVLGDAPPGSQGWEIDVPGQEPMTLSNTAASISGDTARFAMIDGIRYSHVVDPRTGMGVTSRQMAVVLGPRGIDTDPLSTAGCVMEAKAFQALIDQLEGYEARVLTAPDE